MKVMFVRKKLFCKEEVVAVDIERIVITECKNGPVAMCYPVGCDNLDDVLYINLYNLLDYSDVDIVECG